MKPFTVRPTKKFVTAGAALEALLIVLLMGYYLFVLPEESRSLWIIVVPFMFAGLAQALVIIRTQSQKLIVSDGQLTLETGYVQKTRQMVNLDKIYDITVQQGLFERLLNVGSITIQSANSAGGLRLERIDAPAEVANKLLAYARQTK